MVKDIGTTVCVEGWPWKDSSVPFTWQQSVDYIIGIKNYTKYDAKLGNVRNTWDYHKSYTNEGCPQGIAFVSWSIWPTPIIRQQKKYNQYDVFPSVSSRHQSLGSTHAAACLSEFVRRSNCRQKDRQYCWLSRGVWGKLAYCRQRYGLLNRPLGPVCVCLWRFSSFRRLGSLFDSLLTCYLTLSTWIAHTV